MDSVFVPRMYFNDLQKNRSEISRLLNESRSFFYLKGATGSTSRTTFIIKDYQDVPRIINSNPAVKDWFLSENIDSFLYKRKGVYQPGGRVYDEKHGHKGRLKFFILFKIDKNTKEVYMYDQSVYEIAPDEFTGDLNSRSQNIIIGMGSEELHGYPPDYDTDPDYGFNPVDIFGKEYFKTIVPQLHKMTNDIFRVVQRQLYCKNDKYYNRDFKSCFHFGTVDVIITPELKCYFLEINTKPVMDRPSYESIINYPTMVDSIVQICIDPYFPPRIKSAHVKGWHRTGYTTRYKNPYTFYVSPTWKFAREVKEFYQKRRNAEQIIYPYRLLREYSIDFVGKRRRANDIIGDPVFENAKLISKILSLDYYLGDKKSMYEILSTDPKSLEFLPLTLTIDNRNKTKNWVDQVKRIRDSDKKYILKPSNGLRGQDILIANSTSAIIDFIKTHTEYTQWVISEYIDNPYLLKLYGQSRSGAVYDDHIGRKTHIRLYVLVTKIKNRTLIYLYDQPLIFCAVKEYNPDINDRYAQLTNLYIASKYYNEVLGIDGGLAYQDLSFNLRDILDKLYGPSFYKKRVLPQITSMLKIILDNSKEYLYCSSRTIKGNRNCFQNIAIDIMPDENWRLFLLEINGRPGMNAPNYNWNGLGKYTDTMLERLNGKTFNNYRKGFIKIV